MEAGIGGADVITAGHRLSGGLNFPRRITTAYFNSAVSRQFNDFALAIQNGIAELGLNAPVNVLKADGGTMSLASSRIAPVQSILSGPAASIMGIAALCSIAHDAIILDIGGTSTDIAIFAKGSPLLEQEGISLHGNPTLVRSLKTMSIAMGGDSTLRILEGRLSVGPDRSGPSLAAGGAHPALIDALNVTGESNFGNADASHRGIAELAQTAKTTPLVMAHEAIGIAVTAITHAVGHMIQEMNERPVYTIHELLHSAHIAPSQLYIVGGPAQAFADRLSKAFDMNTIVPRLHAVANAVGAAITRTTAALDLFADTERQVLLVPSLSVQKSIAPTYSLDHARRDAESYLRSSLEHSVGSTQDTEIQIIEASSFNMIHGSRMIGRNIRVRCQTKPGYITSYLAGVRSSC
jgi:N-methylhydantoinase A/oxoprolinase/acetone carboxylase beta subunit